MLKLKKRFIRDRSITSAFFAKAEAKKKIVREVSGPVDLSATLSVLSLRVLLGLFHSYLYISFLSI